jgi:hypothetical protein
MEVKEAVVVIIQYHLVSQDQIIHTIQIDLDD